MIKHPTYGTLADLEREMQKTLEEGHHVRMGQTSAMMWFMQEYRQAIPHKAQAEPGASSTKSNHIIEDVKGILHLVARDPSLPDTLKAHLEEASSRLDTVI